MSTWLFGLKCVKLQSSGSSLPRRACNYEIENSVKNFPFLLFDCGHIDFFFFFFKFRQPLNFGTYLLLSVAVEEVVFGRKKKISENTFKCRIYALLHNFQRLPAGQVGVFAEQILVPWPYVWHSWCKWFSCMYHRCEYLKVKLPSFILD